MFIRVAKNLPMDYLKCWVQAELEKQGIMLMNTTIFFAGRLVEDSQMIKEFEPLSLFLVHDGPVPQEYGDHKGKLIQCTQCKDKVDRYDK